MHQHKFNLFSVGLTGGIGCGKTAVANRFSEHGIAVIDTDQIAHKLTAIGGIAIPLIAEHFGPDFIASDGSLQRAKMRAEIFSDKQAKLRLEAILHPLIRLECEAAARVATGPYLIFVVPLLIESGSWKDRVDRTLVVDCSPATQIKRVMQRNGLTYEQAQTIIAHQATRATRLAYADEVISNQEDTPLICLYNKVDALHQYYLKLA